MEQAADEILVDGLLLKAIEPSSEDGADWRFAGIASDITPDIVNDALLRDQLDVSYAAQRGFVNWNHSEQAKDQLGYLTKCEILTPARIEHLRKELGIEIPDTASVYVEGGLYKYVEGAKDVWNVLKSQPVDGSRGLGLSLDGKILRDAATKAPVKAFVRGVAFTQVPAHTRTLTVLRKSLLEGAAKVSSSAEGSREFTLDEAKSHLMKRLPNFTCGAVSTLVDWVAEQKARGANQ